MRGKIAVVDHGFMGKTWGGWASVLALALWAGACASSAAPTGAPLPTLPQDFPSHGSSVLEVRLIYDAPLDCLFVDYNGTRLPAKWPIGYAWMKDHRGVQSPDGKHVARVDELTRVIGIRLHSFTLTSPEVGVGTTAPRKPSCPFDGEVLMISGIA